MKKYHKRTTAHKYCSKCQTYKVFDKFYTVRRGERYVLSSECKNCNSQRTEQRRRNNLPKFREYNKTYYKKHKEQIKIAKNKYWAIREKILYEHLISHPCIDCGETNILVLEFDHVRGKKSGNIFKFKRGNLKMLIKEIAKCDVRCANCHRIKTAKEHNSWKLKYL